MITQDQLDLLAEIFSETERHDKICIKLDHVSRSITVTYDDLDDGWFNEFKDMAMGRTDDHN